MTEQQRSQFSSAWQTLFALLEAKGYTVKWNGRIYITNGVNSLTARLARDRWHVELEKIAGEPKRFANRKDNVVISQIEHMLGDAAHRWEYDLTLRGKTA